MRRQFTIILATLLSCIACGHDGAQAPDFEQKPSELSISVQVDGQTRDVRVFHSTAMAPAKAVSAAHELMSKRLQSPGWLTDRIDIHYWITHGGLEPPQEQPEYEICLEMEDAGDAVICANFSTFDDAEEQDDDNSEAGNDEEDTPPEVEARNTSDELGT